MKYLIAMTMLLSAAAFARAGSFKSIEAIQTLVNSKAAIAQILSQSQTTEVSSVTVEAAGGREFDLVVTTHATDVPCLTPVRLTANADKFTMISVGKTVCRY